MKYIIVLFLFCTNYSWTVAKNHKVYTIVQQGTNIGTTNTNDPSFAIQQTTVRRSRIPTGSQRDVYEFNKKIEKNFPTIFSPKPFNNRTNSYWLDPNFQFGPGSVNDFGGDPNAEQMLNPFIF